MEFDFKGRETLLSTLTPIHTPSKARELLVDRGSGDKADAFGRSI